MRPQTIEPARPPAAAPGSRTILDVLRGERLLRLPLAGAVAVLAMSFLPRVADNARLALSFRGAALLLLAFLVGLAANLARTGRRLELERRAVRSHWVQACAHSSIYLYWGWYWAPVYPELILIYGQIIFLYTFDALLCWSRREKWVLGFGAFPIVYSTNLFLWFKDDWYFFQFALIAVGALGKELLKWRREGRETHIFNPSAFSLTLASILLIATGATAITWGPEVATTLERAPYIYYEIFLLGLVVQYNFAVTLVTLWSVLSCVVLNLIYTSTTGVYFMTDTSIPIAVFLGAHLLITDPATSPKTHTGRAVFGAIYGSSVFALFGLLDAAGIPLFYDKLLPVGILNLCVGGIDWVVRTGPLRRLEPEALGVSPARYNLAAMAAWIALFGGMAATHQFGPQHPGHSLAFWTKAADQHLPNARRNLIGLLSQEARDSGTAAATLGLLYAEGKYVERDPERAADLFAHACELGNTDGCRMLLIRHVIFGEVQNREGAIRRAILQVGKAADAGDPMSAYLVGVACLTGRGLPVDKRRAAELFRRASEAGWVDASTSLARMYLEGDGVPRNTALAAAALERACAGGNGEACAQLAKLTHFGEGVPADESRARTLMKRSCELHWQPACDWINGLNQPHPEQAPR